MKEQLTLIKTEREQPSFPNACVFTGHRVLGEDFSARKLKKEIKNMIEGGVDTFYNGVAMGFDLLAAEYVLELKKSHPHVKLIACVPCYGQEKYFSETDKKRYVKVLHSADTVVTLSEYYYNGCMQKRDRYMVDRADNMIAYCKSSTGGAAYTLRYFIHWKDANNVVYV